MTQRPPDHAMPFLLMAGFRSLVDTVHERLAGMGYPGVRTSHGLAMQALGGGCTGVELGQRLGVTKQAAARTASNLEAMGLVERVASESDGRERLLRPTARGRELLALSGELFTEAVGAWRREAGDAAVDTTLGLLTKVAGAQR